MGTHFRRGTSTHRRLVSSVFNQHQQRGRLQRVAVQHQQEEEQLRPEIEQWGTILLR